MAEEPEAGEGPEQSSMAVAVARFSLLYESRDGRLCLFEDAEGHVTSVDSQRLC